MTELETSTLPGPADQYHVLARKYRPTTFAGLIGQDALVRTLTNAIGSGRLAHAFILTGVRGIGKTTTARIIARAFNCIGVDGQGGPTAEPCGVCEHCRAISEDRHVDVIEMDAASRTGVEDIRELIEGVRYRPTSARYKVYIIDEVHMLSKNAFNALLKTLEEPPEHVKFIFATTETRKVPVTVLSRCQRFDLRRIDMDTLSAHFARIVEKEGADVTGTALALIARAADGSVRDGLSLLDQAISHTKGTVSEETVRSMLGLADRTAVFDLLDAVMRGDIAGALDQMAAQHAAGADPGQVLEDMLDLVHWITRIKVSPASADAPGVAEAERVRGRDMAGRLPMAAVTKAWQMVLKGLAEVRAAPRPEQAAEMILVRLAYAADLPSPEEALRALKDTRADPAPVPAPTVSSSSASPRGGPRQDAPTALHARPVSGMGGAQAARLEEPETAQVPELGREDIPGPSTFEDVVDLTGRLRNVILHANLYNNLHLVRFEPGRIEFRPGDHAPSELAHDLSKFLNENTQRRWVVTVSGEAGEPTLRQRDEACAAAAKARAAETPLVKAVLDAFPGAKIDKVTPIA